MRVEVDPLDYVDCRDGTVIDTLYGLMWMRCAVGQQWDGQTCIGEATTFTWSDAMKIRHKFAEHSDWRLPQLEELKGLVDKHERSPSIDSRLFPNCPVDGFWSDQDNGEGGAWGVRFDRGGKVGMFSKEYSHLCVRLVRAVTVPYGPTAALPGVPLSPSEIEYLSTLGAPLSDEKGNPEAEKTPAFSSLPRSPKQNGTENTITDPVTGLEWMYCVIGQHWDGYVCTGTPEVFTWREALEYVDSLPNRSGWRLPTVEELQSFADRLISSTNTLPGFLLEWDGPCWTSSWIPSYDQKDSHFAWAISICLDQSTRMRRAKTELWSLRLVRVKQEHQDSIHASVVV